MNMKKILCLAFALVMAVAVFAVPAAASSAYQTYVYDIHGMPLHSPDAYTALKNVDSDAMGLETPIANPGDLITDQAMNVYIADSGNNRVVVLDR